MNNRESEETKCPHLANCPEPGKMPRAKIGEVVHAKVMKLVYSGSFLVDEPTEYDCSELSAKEIIEKIRDFIKHGSPEEEYMMFLKLLAYYPMSMCKRDVSKLQQLLIGFLYRTSQENEEPKDAN